MDNYEVGELLKMLERIATSLEKLTSDNSARAEICHHFCEIPMLNEDTGKEEPLYICKSAGKLSPVA